jgi:16S rRNA (cytidine1402-2'-O)-methyltransferase
VSEVARKHQQFMQEALVLAEEAGRLGDVPVGCVIVRGDEIVGRGANEIQRMGDPTRHAEIVAIEQAVRTIGEKFLDDCTLYVTLEPCSMCAGAVLLARIPTVVYGAADPKTGACRSMFELLDDPRLNHQATVRTGICEEECSTLLRDFFARQRERDDAPEDERSQQAAPNTSGALYLVPTPIGNLEDMTLRSVKTLREADVIVCEDTRHTSPLLKKYDVPRKTLLSYHEHNERERAMEIAYRVAQGQKVALVSDAGMPGISDPGYRAVQACIEAGCRVIALPGASALTTAIAASGLPTDVFCFVGFPPQKKGRTQFLETHLAYHGTVVMYESPYRLQELIDDIAHMGGAERKVVVAREISKLHEEYIRGTAADVAAALRARGGVKGEIVVMVAPALQGAL